MFEFLRHGIFCISCETKNNNLVSCKIQRFEEWSHAGRFSVTVFSPFTKHRMKRKRSLFNESYTMING